MSASQQLLLGGVKAIDANYIEDVFSTWLYTGNGSTQTITNGIDLAGKGGLVWLKARSTTGEHALFDTLRGTGTLLNTDSTNQARSETGLASFNADGFSFANAGSTVAINFDGRTFASWTFRKQPKFFDCVTWTGNGASYRTITHNLGSTPGCVMVKRTDSTGDWVCFFPSATAWLTLNTTNAAGPDNTLGGYPGALTATDFLLNPGGSSNVTNVNASGGTYVAYLFAHNAGGFGLTGTDNVISCGSFTTDGSGNATVNLGYEPQWVLRKQSDGSDWWNLSDSMRGMSYTNTASLYPNTSGAEYTGPTLHTPTATGFNVTAITPNATYIYIAIRRGPMKTPTTGTSVFNPNTTSGSTGATVTTNFPVDLQITRNGARSATTSNIAVDRLRGVSTTTTDGGVFLGTTSTNAESSAVAFTRAWDNTGFQVTAQNSGVAQIYWNFRRAPGFLDEVCYTGTGVARTVAHNLTVVPELMIVKSRSAAGYWPVYSAAIGNDYILSLDTTGAKDGPGAPQWNSTTPTASVFSLGASSGANASGVTFVNYLFASCPGVSKVFNFTGNGSSQTINCGFTGGARFVMIKRTDSTGDWYVWDSARGIVSGNDPRLSLNTTAAEVTTDDSVDTDSTGFVVNQLSATNVNVNGASYIGLAIA